MLYEVTIEEMTPCGGEKYAIRRIVEAETDDPVKYVEENKRFPNLHISESKAGDVIITASNPAGYRTKYTFTEI